MWVVGESFELCQLVPNGEIIRFRLQYLLVESLPKEGTISSVCDGRITHEDGSKYVFVDGGGGNHV